MTDGIKSLKEKLEQITRYYNRALTINDDLLELNEQLRRDNTELRVQLARQERRMDPSSFPMTDDDILVCPECHRRVSKDLISRKTGTCYRCRHPTSSASPKAD